MAVRDLTSRFNEGVLDCAFGVRSDRFTGALRPIQPYFTLQNLLTTIGAYSAAASCIDGSTAFAAYSAVVLKTGFYLIGTLDSQERSTPS